jgi:cytochrome c oxidase cbb3-type subunit III
MSLGWSIFVLVLTALTVGGCAWLIMWSSRMEIGDGETTGHTWDGDLVEGNNPLPRWWLGLFWLTIVFGIVYFAAYPSFGRWSLLGWNQVDQYEREITAAEATYGELFAAFAATPIEELSRDPAALNAGRNLFANNCAACHGSDARGARGYPNLTDEEWNWGGDPAQIRTSIQHGRTGIMPAFGATIDDATRDLLTDYVLHLAGRSVALERVEAGAKSFTTYCSACHGPAGDGNPLLGAPKLANEIWLHGSGRSVIYDVITSGRMGQMPAQAPVLGEDRIHVLAAYVYDLSNKARREALARDGGPAADRSAAEHHLVHADDGQDDDEHRRR